MRRCASLAGITLLALAACSPSQPDAVPLQATLTAVSAVALPCRCPPGQECGPCDPQYLVDTGLRLASTSGAAVDVRSFSAELLDVRGNRAASPQSWSVPVVPFSVAASGSEVPLSFITPQGAEVMGGSVRVILAGTDEHGARWDLTVAAAVPR